MLETTHEIKACEKKRSNKVATGTANSNYLQFSKISRNSSGHLKSARGS